MTALTDQIVALADALTEVLRDVHDLEVSHLVDALPRLHRTADRLQAMTGTGLGELQHRHLSHGGGGLGIPLPPCPSDPPGTPARVETPRGWWRATAGLTAQQTGAALRHATVLRSLPVLREATHQGTLRTSQAHQLCRLDDHIDPTELQASQADLLVVAAPLDTHSLGRLVSHWIATHDEPALERDQARATARRYLQLRDQHDGTVRLSGVLPSEDAEALHHALHTLGRSTGPTDLRSAPQRRADALTTLATALPTLLHHTRSTDDRPSSGTPGQHAHLHYVLDATWAARAADAATGGPDFPSSVRTERDQPGSAARTGATATWTGPQTRTRISTLQCGDDRARVTRLLLHADGTIHRLDSPTGLITRAQRLAVVARDRHCTAPGCVVPAPLCDVHHLTHREHGGATCTHNLTLLCRRHHLAWHRGHLHGDQLHTPWLHHPERPPCREGCPLPPPESTLPPPGSARRDAQPPVFLPSQAAPAAHPTRA